MSRRRAAILDRAGPILDRRRRHWVVRRAVVAAGIPLVVLAVVLAVVPWSVSTSGGTDRRGIDRRGTDRSVAGPSPGTGPVVVVEHVVDDPGIVARCTVRTDPSIERYLVDGLDPAALPGLRLDDRELGVWLRESGVDPGRVRVGDRVRVLALEPVAP